MMSGLKIRKRLQKDRFQEERLSLILIAVKEITDLLKKTLVVFQILHFFLSWSHKKED